MLLSDKQTNKQRQLHILRGSNNEM